MISRTARLAAHCFWMYDRRIKAQFRIVRTALHVTGASLHFLSEGTAGLESALGQGQIARRQDVMATGRTGMPISVSLS